MIIMYMFGVKLCLLVALSSCVYGNCIDDDCVFTKWSDWAGCTCAICDETGETKQSCFRSRELLDHAEGCHSECGETFESGCIGQCCNSFCAVTSWSEWSVCRCSDGEATGRQFRNRTGIYELCSVPCDVMDEDRICDDVCCPTDCELAEWSDWTDCSVACNTQVGYKTRDRDMAQGTCGGNMCSQFDASEVERCTGECELSDWSTWNCTCEACIVNSTDIRDYCFRTRISLDNCSASCGDLFEETCSDGDCCDPNCELSNWSGWSDCSALCDSMDVGVQIRTRADVGEQCAGRPCQSLEDWRSCNASCCAHDCSFDAWGMWTECTVNCESDTGTQVRTRHVTQGSCGGSMCLDDDWHDVRVCTGACRLDSWSDWVCLCSSCDEDDLGSRHRECSRRRNEINPEICRPNGDCGRLTDYTCQGNCCDELCTVGEWGDWTTCDAPCGINEKGNMTRTRQPSESCTGEPCSSILEIKKCITSHCCPGDCIVYPWESWSSCSSECSVDDGTRVRYRPFTQGSCNGTLCTEGDRFEIEPCRGSCNISHWSEWSCECQTCSERNESVLYDYCTRNRTVPGSADCSICDEDETICRDFEDKCCNESCVAEEWSTWTTCSVGCESYDNGTQERTRELTEPCNGRLCFDIFDQRECGSECCLENCTLGTWENWSVCSSGCNTLIGSQVRFREISQGTCGGRMCDEVEAMDIRSCYGNCEVSAWSEWNCVCSDCSASNSTLYNECLRTRTEVSYCGGSDPCGDLYERTCSDECCNEVCNLTPWSEWTACSAQCMSDVTGFQIRERNYDDVCLSDPCELLFENRTCGATSCCPINCTLGEWDSWSACSSLCSDQYGYIARYREYEQGSCGGTLCTDEQSYGVEACTGNCTLTNWSTWECMCELCSDEDTKLHNSCIRERSQLEPDNCISSDVCGAMEERGCFEVCCDEFCFVSEWEEWSSCSSPCDTDDIGEQVRLRTPIGLCQSDPCYNLTETRSCLSGCCPVDCLMGEWSEWFSCSSSCQHVTGKQVRARDIEQAYCGGINCTVDDNYETRPCHGECVLTEWSSWNCSCTICDPDDINFHEECFRTRLEVNPEECNTACGDLMETTCSVDDCCDEYCELSEWSEWSECDAGCGINVTGLISRTRQPIAACFSDPCVDVYESVECAGPDCCSVDCQVGEWTIWSSCSSLCSNESGLTYRVREVTQGTCAGELCSDDAGTDISPCYGNCSLNEWTDWDCKCNFCDQEGVLKNDCIRQRSEVEPDSCSSALCGSLIERVCSNECCDEFCILSEWSDWSACTVECNTSVIATKKRQRGPLTWCLSPPCNSTTDTSVCDDTCCPTDCVLGDWNEWLPCSAKCSDTLGTETRERSMIQGSCSGVICSDEAPYETRVCYGECQVSDWSEWYCNCTYCNPTSGNLHHNCSRERTAVTLDGYCSDHCSSTELTCDDECCDDSCTLHQWSEWTECTALCGLNSTALQERYRNASTTCVGVPCDELVETRTCFSPQCCPVNCTVGVWSEWTTCSSKCSGDSGMQHRVREIQNGSCGGDICDVTDEQIDRRECVGDCQVSEWTSWSCGCGYCGSSNYSRQNCNRQRNVNEPDTCSTADCDLEDSKCGDACCDEQCILSEWNGWSNCSKPCDSLGPGITFRERYIVNQCGADPCEAMREENECSPTCCSRDCQIGIWSAWSQCTELCYYDVGIHSRTRDILQESCGGRQCNTNDTDAYQVQQCSGLCGFSEWSEWACECHACNASTEALYNNCTRTRNESNPDICNGNCGHTVENECVHPCCDPHCNVTDWSSWSLCNLDCGVTGQGEQTRFRSVVIDSCQAEPCVPLIESQNCSSECCPRDCSISVWTAWSNCSTHCSIVVGNKSRSRTILQGACGGIECDDLDYEETVECNGTCVLSDWSQWLCGCSFCIPDDPHFHSMCTRSRDQSSECIASECGAIQESSCGDECCDDFCFVGDWTEWTECTVDCGNGSIGTQERSRSQISQMCLGPPCDVLFEDRSCNSTCCPRDCTHHEWGEWTLCSSDCSVLNSTRNRTRGFIQGTCGGIMCGDDEVAEIDECISPCVLSEWNAWSCQCSFCSADDTFLSNICSRQRAEIGADCNNQCGDLTETNCDEECCDDFCFVGEWSEWSECNVTCEADVNGTRVRTREILSNFCLGKPCEDVVDSEFCSTGCCPRDCTTDEWSTWTECSNSCNMSEGIQSRTRDVTEATCGGECLIDLNRIEERNCTGGCQLSEWSSWECSCVFCNPEFASLYSLCERSRIENGLCNGQCGSLVEDECLEPCCDEFCATNEWSAWSNCSDGISARNRNKLSEFCFGDPCGGIMEERVCQNSCCMYTEWTTWSNCSTTCAEDVGTQTRTRSVDSACQENLCNGTTEETQPCSGDCQPSDWSSWDCTCSFCQPGLQILFNNCRRVRTDDSSTWCSEACGPVEETNCTAECCDEFCFWAGWSSWSVCQIDERTRTRGQSSTFCIGSPCGSSIESEACSSSMSTTATVIVPDVVDTSLDSPTVHSDICSATHWSTWSDCYSSCYEHDARQYRYRQLVPVMCNNSQCIETDEETRDCQGTFQSRESVKFDVHRELVFLHNISSVTGNTDNSTSRFFTSKNMRERLLIRDKHLAAFGYTLDEYLRNVTSSDIHTCNSILLESATMSTTKLLNDLTSETFDAESILEILIPLSSQEILTVQDSYFEEYNVTLDVVISTSGLDPALQRLIISLLLGMRAETRVVSMSQIEDDVNLILDGTDIDIQSVLAVRHFEDIQRIDEQFTSSRGDLSEFLADESDDIYTIGYAKIVEYAKSSGDYWTAVIHRLINVTPFPTNKLSRIVTQRAEIDLDEIGGRYLEWYGQRLEDDVRNSYDGPCIEQITGLMK